MLYGIKKRAIGKSVLFHVYLSIYLFYRGRGC